MESCFVGKTKVNIYFCAMNHWPGLDLVGTPGGQGLCGLNWRTAPVGLLSDGVVALRPMLFIAVMFCQILAALFEKWRWLKSSKASHCLICCLLTLFIQESLSEDWSCFSATPCFTVTDVSFWQKRNSDEAIRSFTVLLLIKGSLVVTAW